MKAEKNYPPFAAEKAENVSPAEARRRQRALGRRLRQMFDDVASEPVPDDFMDLLDQLDEKISNDGKSDESKG